MGLAGGAVGNPVGTKMLLGWGDVGVLLGTEDGGERYQRGGTVSGTRGAVAGGGGRSGIGVGGAGIGVG